jgi:hypothetical protein
MQSAPDCERLTGAGYRSPVDAGSVAALACSQRATWCCGPLAVHSIGGVLPAWSTLSVLRLLAGAGQGVSPVT